MKITAIETLVCHARIRNWLFVKVVTDQPGLLGWGGATLEWHTRSVVGAAEDLSQLLVESDPGRVQLEHAKRLLLNTDLPQGLFMRPVACESATTQARRICPCSLK